MLIDYILEIGFVYGIVRTILELKATGGNTMVCIVKHYICEYCCDDFDTMFEAKEHEKKCEVVI